MAFFRVYSLDTYLDEIPDWKPTQALFFFNNFFKTST